MQTPTHETAPRSTRRAAPGVAGKLAYYPELPAADHRLFWLAAYLSDLAEARALDDLHTEVIRSGRSKVIRYAVARACNAANDKVDVTAGHVLRAGLILFAHPANTALVEVPA